MRITDRLTALAVLAAPIAAKAMPSLKDMEPKIKFKPGDGKLNNSCTADGKCYASSPGEEVYCFHSWVNVKSPASVRFGEPFHNAQCGTNLHDCKEIHNHFMDEKSTAAKALAQGKDLPKPEFEFYLDCDLNSRR